jgi:AcrR family transcriptional regulator
LDAAERVVIREGVVGLSIDAVAKEAGISKSRVVYDYKSKSALVAAIVQRGIQVERDRLAAAVADSQDMENPELAGRIACAYQAPGEEDRAVTLAISAAMSSDTAIQKLMRDITASDIQDVENASDNPQAALVAYLAMQGMLCLEYFDFHRWDDAQRQIILENIAKLPALFDNSTQK